MLTIFKPYFGNEKVWTMLMRDQEAGTKIVPKKLFHAVKEGAKTILLQASAPNKV